MSCYIIELADCALTPYAIETESGTEYGWGLMPKRKVDLDELLRVADECDAADVDGVTDWAARRTAVQHRGERVQPLHHVRVRIAPGAGLRLVGRVPGLAAGRIRRRNDKVGGRMSRPGCNRGCLLVIAASLLIDGLTLWAAVSLARMIIGG